MLQILIVGGDDAKSFLLPELLQNGFGNGSANGRLRTSAKLVNQQQCIAISLSHHILHVEQVARIGGQIIGYRLFVADIYHDMTEDTAGRAFADGYGQSALQHILQQAYRLQTYRLTARIRTRDDE